MACLVVGAIFALCCGSTEFIGQSDAAIRQLGERRVKSSFCDALWPDLDDVEEGLVQLATGFVVG